MNKVAHNAIRRIRILRCCRPCFDDKVHQMTVRFSTALKEKAIEERKAEVHHLQAIQGTDDSIHHSDARSFGTFKGIEDNKPPEIHHLESFEQANLGKLISRLDSDYSPPQLPFYPPKVNQDMTSGYHKEDFLLDFNKWTFLNQGAAGATLAVGFKRASAWRNYLERQPLQFFDRDLLPHLAHSTRLLSKFMHSPSNKDLALLPNVTAGLNAVLEGHLKYYGKEKAHVIYWDTTYSLTRKIARQLYAKDNITEIPIQSKYFGRLAQSDHPEKVFVDALHETLAPLKSKLEGKKLLFCLEHTTAKTGLVFPVALLAETIQKEYNYNHNDDAVVLVDGAQAMLVRNINLSDLFEAGVDIYLSNGHKWLGAPHGVGIIASQQKHHDTILRRPAIVGHGVEEPDFLSRFVLDGVRDYAAALSIPAVLDYWNVRNPKGLTCLRYDMRRLMKDGIKILCQYWHPPDYQDEDSWPGRITLVKGDSLYIAPMCLVALPEKQFGSNQSLDDAKRVQSFLYNQRIEVPIKCINGKLYVRISCHVYNTLEDFEKLAKAIVLMSEPVSRTI